MRSYRVQFVRRFGNIEVGSIVNMPEQAAIAVVGRGYAVYYVV